MLTSPSNNHRCTMHNISSMNLPSNHLLVCNRVWMKDVLIHASIFYRDWLNIHDCFWVKEGEIFEGQRMKLRFYEIVYKRAIFVLL